jgi:hypothetical protein
MSHYDTGSTTKIGNLDGFIDVPYEFGTNTVLDNLNTLYYHVHGTPFVYPNSASNVVLTSGTDAWSTGGAIIEVVPADTLSVSFTLGECISNISNSGVTDKYI